MMSSRRVVWLLALLAVLPAWGQEAWSQEDEQAALKLSPCPCGAESHLDSTEGRHHDASVRTTITLEPDVAEQLERAARVSGKTFKTTVNEALRIGLGLTGKSIEPPRFQIRSFVNGLQPGIDPDKMNQLLDQLEAEDVARKHQG